MPTMGRLIGAVLFTPLGFYLATLAIPLFPDGTDPPYLTYIAAGAGLFAGWVVAGSRAPAGYSGAIGYGLTAGAALAFWALFLSSFTEMILRSLDKRYQGPMEAVVSVFQLSMDYALVMGTSVIITTWLAGSIIGGMIVEWFAQRFP
jgi:hypothetical protein